MGWSFYDVLCKGRGAWTSIKKYVLCEIVSKERCESPRAIKAVRIRYKATEAVLLEVDTSDGIKMLSTKVLFGSELQDWIDQFLQIRKGVVEKSINTVGYVPWDIT